MALEGEPPKIGPVTFAFELRAVTDHYGNTFLPPTSHLGRPLADPSPLGVGAAALSYYVELVAEAGALASIA